MVWLRLPSGGLVNAAHAQDIVVLPPLGEWRHWGARISLVTGEGRD